MRLSRESMMMGIAQTVALRGTCDRLQVGAVIARDSRVISTGYNGNVTHQPHCNHSGDDRPCESAVHAECNAVAYAARHGVAIDGAELYVTHQPCLNCAKLIANSGIIRVYYSYEYRLIAGIELLQGSNIEVICLTQR